MRKFQGLYSGEKALANKIKSTSPTQMSVGRVISSDDVSKTAKVKIGGSGLTTICDVAENVGVSIGMRVIVVSFADAPRPVVIAGTKTSTSYVAGTASDAAAKIEVPTNITAFGLEAGCIVAWDAPFVDDQFFIVEESLTGTEDDAIQVLVTQGSYYIHNGTGTIYFRVQAAIIIDSGVRVSDWTAWVSAAATMTLAGEIEELEERLDLHILEGI